MKTTTAHTKEVWASGDFVGEDRRPTMRATISKLTVSASQYRYPETRAEEWAHSGNFTSVFFGQANNRPRELPNIQSLKWTRGVDSDVGTCTIVLANTDPQAPVSTAELDQPGYFTPNRGSGAYFDQWGYVKNSWKNWLLPDRVIRTYEGYGADYTVAPEVDPNAYPSGVWLIDDVVLDAAGTITLECRDMGRILLDQVIVAPAIPWTVAPLTFDKFAQRGEPFTYPTADWQTMTYYGDSNTKYRGLGLEDDDGSPIMSPDGTVLGHHGRDAFDYSTSTYWLSVGHSTSDSWAWVSGTLPTASTVAGVRLDSAVQGRVRVYVSLQHEDGSWAGTKKIPYSNRHAPDKIDAVNLGANVPYVHSFVMKAGATIPVRLPRAYDNIKHIRFTFHHLPWTPYGYNLNFRVACAKLYWAPSVTMTPRAGAWKHGNYGDYTTVVKWLLAWAGWFWPPTAEGKGAIRFSDNSTINVVPSGPDPDLINGRVWGDFMLTGTAGIAKLDVDVFDKKPFMDGIAAVREVVGFDFWIDETGGVVWRLPNVFTKGCYVMPTVGGPHASRTTSLLTVHEHDTVMGLNVRLTSKSVRERIWVGTADGKYGATVRGYMPDSTGLRRFGGWTDQHFSSRAECERMADLIALRQSFQYRQNQITIPGNPQIQPDDQIIVEERTTGEGFIHRVLNISSDWNASTGQWTYSLTTNWLGDQAFTNLAYNPAYLRNITRQYLQNAGVI